MEQKEAVTDITSQNLNPGVVVNLDPPVIVDDCVVSRVASRSDMRHFKKMPRWLYACDPMAVMPLSELQDVVLDRQRHPFYDHGRGAVAEFFLAFDRQTRKPVGRIAAIIDHRHNRLSQERDPGHKPIGHFGFFDCVNRAPVARALIDAAASWLQSQGMAQMLGPASPSQSYDYGLLIEGHEKPHRFLLPYHPAYYADLLEGCGLRKAKDLVSMSGDFEDPLCRQRVQRVIERTDAMLARAAGDVTVRPINMRRYRADARSFGEVLNEALRDHFGHSPISAAEWKLITDSLRPVVIPDFILIAERHGKAVGLAIAIPDINEIIGRLRLRWKYIEVLEFLVRLWRSKPKCVTILVMGATREGNNFGVAPMMVGQLARNLMAHGVRFVDAHQILEDNHGMLDPMLRHGFVADRRFRVYQMDLHPTT